MFREVILVCGVTGSGKTTWARQFTNKLPRLFVYDIALSFPVQYLDAESIANFAQEPSDNFRLGIYDSRDADVLAAAAFVVGNCWLVLEEISTLYDVGARVHGPIQEAILLGRQRALSMLIISQRASYIPITLRSQASRIISFRQQETADVKWLTDFMGKQAEILPTLPDLSCVDWHKGIVTKYSIPHLPETHTQTHIQTHTHSNAHSE